MNRDERDAAAPRKAARSFLTVASVDPSARLRLGLPRPTATAVRESALSSRVFAAQPGWVVLTTDPDCLPTRPARPLIDPAGRLTLGLLLWERYLDGAPRVVVRYQHATRRLVVIDHRLISATVDKRIRKQGVRFGWWSP
ncbi:hypothetical protein KRR39_08020 [Nocardioides panacis]|jgi:hypothetical protein|uniref:Uncharacterized protein n=1 Tax=Nocardioides panacis TaxID=2849501 RepID=A0A975T152_9ACTN|nr:hypothetical protein [Nocardioides panacis]QWZ09674.1 hypothetical protein KRR39_08020 [Nocardioides panacis]